MERIASRIKAFRKASGLSQVQLAKKAGISPVTLSSVERCEDCKMSVILKIEAALKCSLF